MKSTYLFVPYLISGFVAFFGNSYASSNDQIEGKEFQNKNGIVFQCNSDAIKNIEIDIHSYLREVGIAGNMYATTQDEAAGTLSLILKDVTGSTNTINMIDRDIFDIKEEFVLLPGKTKNGRKVLTVSKKEILLAMLQKGRVTQFSGPECNLTALRDQVGIRQNTVAWSENIEWSWPEGKAARWNSKYWNHGDLRPGRSLQEALFDVFVHQRKYAIGCYTATKLVIVHGILDYYSRIKKDAKTTALIESRLMSNGDPLTNIEPGAMWFFEADSSPADLVRPGKLVRLDHKVAPDNFIPGDWSYFLNTDAETYKKTGYEGSNAIYLGRGKFDDYYNDHNHSYTYKEKLLEVYQWRHHVFSRARDFSKINPLTAREISALTKAPEKGGIELDYRAVPYNFAFETLPLLK